MRCSERRPRCSRLFDRKPVSERIGPAAITALRRIDAITFDRAGAGWKRDPQSRMIVFGHSLGGNMLATALRETMLDRIARHVPGAAMTAPFGDLIVLLNPASEASNWTVLQRAMRERVRFLYPMREANVPAEIDRDTKEITEGHKFYPVHQPPVYVTLGSANTWPAGGIRKADVKYLHRQIFGEQAAQCVADLRRGRCYAGSGRSHEGVQGDAAPQGNPRSPALRLGDARSLSCVSVRFSRRRRHAGGNRQRRMCRTTYAA